MKTTKAERDRARDAMRATHDGDMASLEQDWFDNLMWRVLDDVDRVEEMEKLLAKSSDLLARWTRTVA